MTQATGKRRGHGEDSIYWDESKSRYVGAVSLGFSASGARLRKKVGGRTKTEVRDKLRELHQQVLRMFIAARPGCTRCRSADYRRAR